jgi:hypothetical protein
MGDPVHEKFLASLPESEVAVWHFAYWMNQTGHTFQMHPTTKAPTRKEYRKHSDKGDLYIGNPLENRWDRYEVKHRQKKDFKLEYPSKDFVIDGQYQFDRKSPGPDFYIAVNQSMTYYARLDVKMTREKWFVKNGYNKFTEEEQPNWYCSRDLVECFRMSNNPVDLI